MAEIRVNSTGGVKLFDADDSHYAQIKAGTISSNTDVLELGSGAVVAGTKIDLNGQELILDADADTSITADTDDQIDVRIAGADDFQFTANTFTAQSGSSIVVPDGGLTFGSTAISSTAAELNILDGVTSTTAELNILDGVTSTAAELNIVDGNTSATSTTIADADRIVLNDNGTMVQAAVTDLKTYIGGSGLVPITTVAFSSGTELVINNCFSSTYLNYMMIISLLVPSSDASLNYRFNVGGTVDSTSNYRYTLAGTQNSSSGTTSQSNGTTDEGRLFYDIDADSEAGASGVFYIHNPFGGFQRKQIHGNTMLQKATASNTTQYQVASDYHNSTVKNFTGINLFSSGATNWRAGSTSGGYGRVSIFGIVNS